MCFWVLNPLELKLDKIVSQCKVLGPKPYKSSQCSKPLSHLSRPDRCFLYTGLLSKGPDSKCFLFCLPCGSCSLLSEVPYTHAQLCVFVRKELGKLADAQGELGSLSIGPWADRNLMVSWSLPPASCSFLLLRTVLCFAQLEEKWYDSSLCRFELVSSYACTRTYTHVSLSLTPFLLIALCSKKADR